MSEETVTDTTVVTEVSSETPSSTDTTAPAERMYTQAEHEAELTRVVKERLARERKRTKNQTSPKAETTSPKADVTDERIAALERQVQEQRFTAEALRRGITDDAQIGVLRSAFAHDQPENIGDWLDERRGMFAAEQPKEPEQVKEQPPQETPKTPGAPASDGGAPATGFDFDSVIDATKLTRDDIDRLQSAGRFHDVIERYRHSLPGGGNGIFGRRRSPKG